MRASRVAPGGTRQGLMLWRSALRADCTAMLGLRSRRRTHCANCVRSVRTAAPGQSTKRAARADRRPALLAATEIAPAGYRLPRATVLGIRHERPRRPCEGAPGQDGARLGGAEKRRARGRARSALRHLTRRGCSSAVSKANEASSATGHETEHRRGVGATAPAAEVKRPGLPGRTFAAQLIARTADAHGQQRAVSCPSASAGAHCGVSSFAAACSFCSACCSIFI